MWPASTSPGSSPPISTSWLYERLRRKREIQTVKLNLRMFGRSTYDLLLHFLWQQLICCSETRRRNLQRRAPTKQTIVLREASYTCELHGCRRVIGRLGVTPPKETQSLNWTDLLVTLTAGQETLLFTLLLIEMGKIQHVAPSVVINLYWRGQTLPPPPPNIQIWSKCSPNTEVKSRPLWWSTRTLFQ